MAKKTIIFYGTTKQISTEINRYIKKAGGAPAAFCIWDGWIKNYKTRKLLNKYDILTLDEALKKYPDAEFWILYDDTAYFSKLLLEKTSPEKIHFIKDNLEYKKGCSFLGHFIDYYTDAFCPCCMNQGIAVKTQGSIPERISHWKEFVTKLMTDLNNGTPTVCDNCKLLTKGFFPKTAKLDYICFSTNHPGDVCNLRCSYCFVQNNFEKYKENKGFTTYEVLKQLYEMPEFNNSSFTIELANGEPCANKNSSEIFDLLIKSNWKAKIVTNMTIYNEKFAEFLKTGRTTQILTSLDSGTPETFKKIKQADLFNKVIENIKKYPLENNNFCLKYIFLEDVNDNIVDVDGFYNVVKEVGCKTIVIAGDYKKTYTEKMRKMAARLIEKAKKDGIKVTRSAHLSKDDAKYVDELISKQISLDNSQQIDLKCKTIKVDGKNITLDASLLTDNAKYVIILGDNSTITINGNICIASNDNK